MTDEKIAIVEDAVNEYQPQKPINEAIHQWAGTRCR